MAEFGLVAPKGPASLKLLEQALAQPDIVLPDPVREMGALYLEQIGQLTGIIKQLADDLESATKTDYELRRLCTVPGVGPLTAGAIAAFAPDLSTFDSGRNFAAWLGLVPRQRSTGGKARLGAVSKMGQCDIRKLLIVGAMSVIRWVVRKGGSANRWLDSLVARTQAAHGGSRGPGEQDGSHDLGDDGETGELQNGVTLIYRQGNGMAARPGQGDRPTE